MTVVGIALNMYETRENETKKKHALIFPPPQEFCN
jgi:hypothetical protein